ncbi:MAG: hypothetical protein PVI23_02555 [Maricaulaceae bacterium]|jgi:hypothetical protein
MRITKLLLAGVAGSFALAGAGLAQDADAATDEAAAAAEAPAAGWSKASKMGDLLDNEATAAVFEEHLPDVPLMDYYDMIAEMSLEELAQMPEAYMIADKLDEIDADLQAVDTAAAE